MQRAEKIPTLEIIGLPDTAVKEARERIRAAITNSGIRFPSMEIILNLAPANRKKEGSSFDLAMLVSVLACTETLPDPALLDRKCFIGELSLSGEIRPVNGVLCMCLAARAHGKTEIFVPAANAGEASVVPRCDGVPGSLSDGSGVSSARRDGDHAGIF